MNMPVVYQNAIMQYSDCAEAEKAWLWAADTYDKTVNKYKADSFANGVAAIYRAGLESMIESHLGRYSNDALPNVNSHEVSGDLIKFTVKRWANATLGSNVKMWWE